MVTVGVDWAGRRVGQRVVECARIRFLRSSGDGCPRKVRTTDAPPTKAASPDREAGVRGLTP